MSIKNVSRVVIGMSLFLAGPQVAAGGKGVEWGYTGDAGADRWGRLSPDFALCDSGKNQSPIDITGALDTSLKPLRMHYGKTMYEVIHNGHTVQVNSQPGSVLHLEGKEYELKQVHFHAPSENHIDGKSFPMEAHFVHADAEGNLAVVGVMFETGDKNEALARYWQHMPGKHSRKPLKKTVQAGGLLPENLEDYYRFNGSLTTPPCSEGVKWMVLKTPVMASDKQIQQFTEAVGVNNRPVQPINARVIVD